MRDNIYYIDPARHNSNLWESAVSGVEPTGEIYDQETDTAFKGEPNWLQIADIYKQAEAEAPRIYDWQTEADFPNESTEAAQKLSWRTRARNFMGKAAKVLDEATIDTLSIAQTAGDQMSLPEIFKGGRKNKLRRRAVAGLVAGVLAVGGAVEVGMSDSTSAILQGGAARIQSRAAKPHQTRLSAEEKVSTTILTDNENPWTISEAQLETSGIGSPSVAEITEYDQDLLKVNHITLKQSYNLKSGTELKLPKLN
jgi:hypothetical protein